MKIWEANIFVTITPYVPKHGRLKNVLLHQDFACHEDFNFKMRENNLNNLNMVNSVDSHKEFKFNVAKDKNFNNHSIPYPCYCLHNVLKSNVKVRRITLSLDSLFFSYFVLQVQQSQILRVSLLLRLLSCFKKRCIFKDLSSENHVCSICRSVPWNIRVFARLTWPQKDILDTEWNRRIQLLVNEKCELENAMAWLSTLGGASSALGDNYYFWAEKACVISLQQLHIALRLGDPITICRCKIYLAMSLLQRGHFKRAKFMIREQYGFCTKGLARQDFRLKNMCIAAWNRWKYCRTVQIHAIVKNKEK